jgi:hypothetical protein
VTHGEGVTGADAKRRSPPEVWVFPMLHFFSPAMLLEVKKSIPVFLGEIFTATYTFLISRFIIFSDYFV